MIDMHTHLLPQIDDGSNSLEATLKQLQMMADNGIERVYLTSHYFRGHYQYTREGYDQNFAQVAAAAQASKINIDLQPGFEIYLQPNILSDIQERNLTLGDSSYILIESDLNGLPNDFYSNVYPLLRAGYHPILAHAERYVSIMRKPSLAESLAHRNVYVQTNAGSLLGAYGEKVKETGWRLVRRGWTHFLASDDHVRGAYYSLPQAYQEIAKEVDQHTADLLCSIHPAALASGRRIPYHYVEVIRPHSHHRRSWWKRLFA